MAQIDGRWGPIPRHTACIVRLGRFRWGAKLYRDLFLVGFATLAGFTASGIFANLYRLLAHKPETMGGRIGYMAVMVVAAISAYWSFALGLFMIQIGLAI